MLLNGIRGKVLSVTDARGNQSLMTYNPLGWKLTEANALGQVTMGSDTILTAI